MATPLCSLATGINTKVLNAFASAAASSSPVAVPLKRSGSTVAWQTSFDAAPDAVSITIEGSLDNIAWVVLTTTTATAGALGTVTAYPFLRASIGSVTKGANATTTVSFTLF